MISFENFKSDGQTPIYMQIVTYIKRGTVSGTIKDGEELPSRRAISVLLGINPNTVQKAFSILEGEGLISSSHGVTSVMTLSEDTVSRLRDEIFEADIKRLAGGLKQSGLSLEQTIGLLAAYWEEV